MLVSRIYWIELFTNNSLLYNFLKIVIQYQRKCFFPLHSLKVSKLDIRFLLEISYISFRTNYALCLNNLINSSFIQLCIECILSSKYKIRLKSWSNDFVQLFNFVLFDNFWNLFILILPKMLIEIIYKIREQEKVDERKCWIVLIIISTGNLH